MCFVRHNNILQCFYAVFDGNMVGSYAVAGMFMVELRFYTRHAETVFTVARAVSKT